MFPMACESCGTRPSISKRRVAKMWKPSSLESLWVAATEAIETAETAPGWVTNLPFMIAGL